MNLKSEIEAAIGAHGMWKTRLKSAIHSGSSEVVPAVATRDDQCAFGKWLHGLQEKSVKDSPNYRQCMDLHRRFHREVGRVLDLAIANKKAEAEQAMASGSGFAATSTELTRVMMRWASESA